MRSMKSIRLMKSMTRGLCALALAVGTSATWAQSPSAQRVPSSSPPKTFYLTNTFQAGDANDLVTALRNMLAPENKIYLVTSQNAVVVSGTPEQLEEADKLIHELDRPKKVYKLTYTVVESDGGKRIGVQHFDMVVTGGQRTVLKQGSKVPVVTGNFTSGTNSSQNQFTYLDIGLNFDATLDEFTNGVRLRTKVERSSVAESSNGPTEAAIHQSLPTDPVIRQTSLEGTSLLVAGKPQILGSLDIPDTTRHLDIEVEMNVMR